ncbi:hypothetical protein B0H10DRAFT_2222429 [Mycena sp. CBHHK59/15]|nr:hypothetical protein B0H10DRAFT_2222429 [Mycena sp. CBHHK59/15]
MACPAFAYSPSYDNTDQRNGFLPRWPIRARAVICASARSSRRMERSFPQPSVAVHGLLPRSYKLLLCAGKTGVAQLGSRLLARECEWLRTCVEPAIPEFEAPAELSRSGHDRFRQPTNVVHVSRLHSLGAPGIKAALISYHFSYRAVSDASAMHAAAPGIIRALGSIASQEGEGTHLRFPPISYHQSQQMACDSIDATQAQGCAPANAADPAMPIELNWCAQRPRHARKSACDCALLMPEVEPSIRAGELAAQPAVGAGPAYTCTPACVQCGGGEMACPGGAILRTQIGWLHYFTCEAQNAGQDLISCCFNNP